MFCSKSSWTITFNNLVVSVTAVLSHKWHKLTTCSWFTYLRYPSEKYRFTIFTHMSTEKKHSELIFLSELWNHDIASVNLCFPEACTNPKQKTPSPGTFQMGLFCHQYTADTGCCSGHKTQHKGADTVPFTVPFYTDKGLQTAGCTSICLSATQNFWDIAAPWIELEIVQASYRGGLTPAFKTRYTCITLSEVNWSSPYNMEVKTIVVC